MGNICKIHDIQFSKYWIVGAEHVPPSYPFKEVSKPGLSESVRPW
jgi:hypothetical protein